MSSFVNKSEVKKTLHSKTYLDKLHKRAIYVSCRSVFTKQVLAFYKVKKINA